MPVQVWMPQLGESVTEGTITKWLKAVGERVEEFEPLVEVNTDKVDTEIPSPASGIVLEILVPEGTVVKTGAALALISGGEEVLEPGPSSGQAAQDLPPAEILPIMPAPAPEPTAQERPGAGLHFSSGQENCQRTPGRPVPGHRQRDGRQDHKTGHPLLHRVTPG